MTIITYARLPKSCIHIYIAQAVVFIITFYLCLQHFSAPPKSKIEKLVGIDDPLKQNTWRRLKGKTFDQQEFKLKVDFASEEVGSKIIAQSKKLLHVKSIQNNDRNSYLLAPCQKTDWFILSLPESICIKQVAFVSYEYYASTYKTIRISASPVYPTDKWNVLAEVETEVGQTEVFDISSVLDLSDNVDCWAKYLRVELLDFHDVEQNYYCSLTSMKVYGSTAVDVLEREIGEGSATVQREGYTMEKPSIEQGNGAEMDTSAHGNTTVSYTIDEKPGSENRVMTNYKGLSRSFVKKCNKCDDRTHLVTYALLNFMIRLTKSSNHSNLNRKLHHILVRLLQWMKCGHRGIISTLNNHEHLFDQFPFRNEHCLDIILKVRLPVHSKWFEALIYHMIRKNFIHLNENMERYIVNPPILLCKRRCGFLGRFTCYSGFFAASFATFISSRKKEGFMPTGLSVVPLSGNYIFFTEGTYKRLAYISKDVITNVPLGMGSSVVASRILSGSDVSVLTFSNKTCKLNMKGHMPPDVKVHNSITDLFFKSYVRTDHGTTTPVRRDLRFHADILNYTGLLDSVKKCCDECPLVMMEPKNPHKSYHRMYPGRSGTHSTSSGAEEERNNPLKKSQGHKHVLLQLSERVKSLESFANQINQKVNHMKETMDSYAQSKRRLINRNAEKTSMRNLGKWSITDEEYAALLKSFNIRRLRVIFIHKIPLSILSRQKCIKRDVSPRFPSCIFLLRGEEEFMDQIQDNICPITMIRPNRIKSTCSRMIPLIRLSTHMRAVSSYKLIECCRKYGCECSHVSYGEESLLLWIPHFARIRSVDYSYFILGNISRYSRMYMRYVMGNTLVLLSTLLRFLFNIYTISICFVMSQIFWFYRDRETRVLMYNIYEGTYRLQRAQTL